MIRMPTPDASGCPDEGELRAFASGNIDAAQLDRVATHFEQCPQCQEKLAACDVEDPLVVALRGRPSVSVQGVPAGRGLAEFLSAAKRLGTSWVQSQELFEAEPLPLPDRVGRYRVLKEIGRGGMGRVYLAEDAQLHRRVALKCPTREGGADRARLQQEAEALARLDHPGICPIYDVDLLAAQPYLALKWIDGETLEDRLRREPVSPQQAVEWCLKIAEALDAAHQQGIVHRDLKPGNIMLEKSGTIWLMDFGLSKLLSGAEGLTLPGVSPGTPGYMAPEQIEPRLGAVTAKSDLFSLGVLLYEMLTGERPFRGTRQEILAQTLACRVPVPSRVRPGLDSRLDTVCAQSVCPEPSARYVSAKAFAEDLREVLTHPQVRRPMRWLAIAAGFVLAIGLGAWAMQVGNRSETDGGGLASTSQKRNDDADLYGTTDSPANTETPPAARPDLPRVGEPLAANFPTEEERPRSDAAAPDELPKKAVAVLEKYCYACHANDKKYPGLDLRDRVTLLQPADRNEKPYLVPGKPEASRLWQVVGLGNPSQMPPEDQPQPTAAEKELLKQWIAGGAEFPRPERKLRTFIGEQTLLALIDADLQKQPQAKRPYLRYFSLAHLWNSELSDEHLRLVRAGVSKLINSLSSEATITRPELVDADGIVLRIDLRDYGWRIGKQWQEVVKAYPYGLEVAGEAYQRIKTSGNEFPYLRADWFVYTASRPPLYHALVTLPDEVGLPETQSVLERLLAVDPVGNYDKDKIKRAAFTGEASGVSDHNRLVERHPARYGYYWPSYDFVGDDGKQNLFRFPLGPKRLSRSDDGAFEHDGGELIFSLPNGLQAYMLVKADGTRIDKGPQEIVRDPNQHAGAYDIVNGISCMGCHRHGMVRFTDTLREQFANRAGETAEKVLRLYPEAKEMSRLVEADRKRFLQSLDECIGPFVRKGTDDKTDIETYPEPITAVAKPYDRPLRTADVARELGLPAKADDAKAVGLKSTASELGAVIRLSEALRQLGLGPLEANGAISRKQWETIFRRAARELGVGTPLSVN